jgi:hypothetical protein
LQLPREDVPVHNCCCVQLGTMALEVMLSQTILQPHNSVQVQFRCRNQSMIKVLTVRMQLQQMVKWNVDHHQHSESVACDLDRKKDCEAKEYPELAKRHRRLLRHSPYEQAMPFQQSDGNNSNNNTMKLAWFQDRSATERLRFVSGASRSIATCAFGVIVNRDDANSNQSSTACTTLSPKPP